MPGAGGWGCLVQGGSLLPGAVPGPGGAVVQGGLVPGGPAPKGGVETPPVTATAAGSTHSTGMHSCYFCKHNISVLPSQKYKNPCVSQSKYFVLRIF